ncbi:hypothetical protein L195_g002170 [Trifolium pratense]|uniref:Uncharacterized protein n=2 Tax=Trifolium pratense TaxID=57577 RepID=A0ACB0M891_TRIPR|nr:uncharacterized protein LOC123914533 [Trifolium pratense]PNY05715.1 hypothetical protein L195_g002170 [Trifolium pratense]CAJ2676820.1 unnamed protein product [Trifolium pratense]
MPVSDPSSGRVFIWIITCLLFISLIAGGVCLAAYLILPESETSSWIPIAGVALVCLPWTFWFFTCLYRIFSRCCGCRVRLGVNGGGGGGGNWGGANAPKNADVEVANQSTKGGNELNRMSSVASHESEMALAKSMGS